MTQGKKDYRNCTAEEKAAALDNLSKLTREVGKTNSEILDNLAVIHGGNTFQMGKSFATLTLTNLESYVKAVAKPGTGYADIVKLHRAFIEHAMRELAEMENESDATEDLLQKFCEMMGLDRDKVVAFNL